MEIRDLAQFETVMDEFVREFQSKDDMNKIRSVRAKIEEAKVYSSDRHGKLEEMISQLATRVSRADLKVASAKAESESEKQKWNLAEEKRSAALSEVDETTAAVAATRAELSNLLKRKAQLQTEKAQLEDESELAKLRDELSALIQFSDVHFNHESAPSVVRGFLTTSCVVPFELDASTLPDVELTASLWNSLLTA
eukprot:gnl/Spiro4/2791_TR1354_c0_g1_i1.p1 gnl/Spiro4/2791_TR1354_c0_g1~~gnl/Spiro4/2791_TR1354_c0_g1_i1.p1  ORF type:complete len:211 (-),score=57.51 gnl/Spiro4/2791_TR1354_c0_g1_i1:186-773(-)